MHSSIHPSNDHPFIHPSIHPFIHSFCLSRHHSDTLVAATMGRGIYTLKNAKDALLKVGEWNVREILSSPPPSHNPSISHPPHPTRKRTLALTYPPTCTQPHTPTHTFRYAPAVPPPLTTTSPLLLQTGCPKSRPRASSQPSSEQ
jgi:hypothetical protein